MVANITALTDSDQSCRCRRFSNHVEDVLCLVGMYRAVEGQAHGLYRSRGVSDLKRPAYADSFESPRSRYRNPMRPMLPASECCGRGVLVVFQGATGFVADDIGSVTA